MSLSDTYEKVKPAIAAIALKKQDGDSTKFIVFGTGFCVDPDGIVVTARHVVAGYYEMVLKKEFPHSESEARKPMAMPEFLVVFFRRESGRVTALARPVMGMNYLVEGERPEDDEAELDIGKCPASWAAQWPFLEFAELSAAREGDEVATAGYPLKVDPIDGIMPDLSKGIISRIDMRIGKDKNQETARLVLDIRVNPGNSGGPVFGVHSGKVFGVISSERLRDQDNVPKQLKGLFKIPTGIVYCLPCGQGVKECVSMLKSTRPKPSNQTRKP